MEYVTQVLDDSAATSPFGPRETATGRPRAAALLVLRALVELGRGTTTNDIARHIGVHPNSARTHLEQLADARLAELVPTPIHGRGRPPKMFAATIAGRQLAGEQPDPTRSIALIDAVSDTLGDGPEASEQARAIGRAWGERIRAQGDDGADMMTLLAEMGFTPERSEEGIRLLTCPFLTAARERPSVVCAMHQGLVDALAEQGAILHPFAEPGACVLSLRGGS